MTEPKALPDAQQKPQQWTGRVRLARAARTFCLLSLVVGAIHATALQAASADESLGRLEVSDLLLEPTYILTEPRQGQFRIGNSYLAARWSRDSVISAVFKVGSTDLIGVPARYGSAPANQLGFVEAYAQADSDYGRARFGLIPIPFGLEGGDAERRLNFPRSLLFQTRMVNIRDHGASFRIANEGFFSDWAIHNGEGGTDLDNETWFTARWGWQDNHRFRVGLSGSVGSTSTKSTNPSGTSTSTDALLDVNKGSRIRLANFFFEWDLMPVKLLFESTAGDTRQDDNVIKYRELHADAEIKGGSSTLWLLRYDTMDPRSDLPADQVTELTAGVAFRSHYENSVFYILGTKRIQQDVSRDVHKAMIYWRLTPTASTSQSAL